MLAHDPFGPLVNMLLSNPAAREALSQQFSLRGQAFDQPRTDYLSQVRRQQYCCNEFSLKDSSLGTIGYARAATLGTKFRTTTGASLARAL